LVFHFGLFDMFSTIQEKHSLKLIFSNGKVLFFNDKRNFGFIKLLTFEKFQIIYNKLGYDLLSGEYGEEVII